MSDRMQPSTAKGRARSPFGGAVALALTAAALAACQSIEPSTVSPRWRIEPTQRVTDGGETAPHYYALGRYYQGQHRVQLALDAYRRAVAMDPRYAEAHNALGAMIGLQGRLDEAIREFQTALEITPSAPHILSNLGYALALSGRLSEAIPLLQRAAALDPANARISSNLALAVRGADRVAVVLEPAAEKVSTSSAPRDVEEPYASEATRAQTLAPVALATPIVADRY